MGRDRDRDLDGRDRDDEHQIFPMPFGKTVNTGMYRYTKLELFPICTARHKVSAERPDVWPQRLIRRGQTQNLFASQRSEKRVVIQTLRRKEFLPFLNLISAVVVSGPSSVSTPAVTAFAKPFLKRGREERAQHCRAGFFLCTCDYT